MIKQFKDYATTQAYTDGQQLPKGAYIVKIMGASIKENSKGQYIQVGCDIAEGEYKDFYAALYKNDKREDKKWGCNYLLSIPLDNGTEQDGWTKRRFKSFTEALEESNNGYHFDWDEQKFKGKLFGGLFNEQDYQANDGSIKTAVKIGKVVPVSQVREGTYKMPNDKKLNGSSSNSSANGDKDFMNIPDGIEEELPF